FDQWEAQDGTKRSKHRVYIERFTFVDSRGGAAPGPAAPPPQAAPAPPPS
ncbi:unnamed protein product, partial [marine sediment metagenome]